MTSRVNTDIDIDVEEVEHMASSLGIPMHVAEKIIWKRNIHGLIEEITHEGCRGEKVTFILKEILANV